MSVLDDIMGPKILEVSAPSVNPSLWMHLFNHCLKVNLEAKANLRDLYDETSFIYVQTAGVGYIHKTSQQGLVYISRVILGSGLFTLDNSYDMAADYYAITPCQILCVAPSMYHSKIQHNSDFVRTVLVDKQQTSKNYARHVDMLSAKLSISSVAAFMDMMIDYPEARDGEYINLLLTRQEMARYLNLTVETVSRKVSELQKIGAIERNGYTKIKILDRKMLQCISQGGSGARNLNL